MKPVGAMLLYRDLRNLTKPDHEQCSEKEMERQESSLVELWSHGCTSQRKVRHRAPC